jgi:signal transduction histidine kinase
VQRLLEAADEELRRVSMIATQTLRFHKQSTRPQAISCADLFSTVLTLYAGRLKNSNIAVEIRERTTQPVVCFEGDIRQVLSNLIGNAIDAMPQGGRLILRSRLTMDWKTGRRGFALTVADTGSGMDKATMRRIFEAFFTTKGFAGTGLGLWVCAEVMERHHGRLQVRSSQHRGTVITVFLPTELPPADENRSPQ